MAATFRPLRSLALRNARVAAPRVAPRIATIPAARTYATPAAAAAAPKSGGGGSSSTVIGILAALAAGAGGWYYFVADEDQKKAIFSQASSLTGGSKDEPFPNGVARGPEDYQKVYNAVADLLESESYEDGHYGPVLVRLGWHASGTYDKNSGGGGSNGATMRFAPESNHGANAGLLAARDLLEKVHVKFPWITYSDLWTLAAVAAIQEMGGPTIPWRPGRRDGLEANCTPDGRLPDGDKGPDHLRHIFYRMGFNDQEIVALSGAHALGRCHSDRSGFEGPWTFAPTSFTNEYYNLLLNEKWQFKKWKGPIQYEDKSTKSLMMLTTDMALVQDKSFRPHVERYAKDEDVFFDEFSKVFRKLVELGVPAENWKPWEAKSGGKAYELQTSAAQENAK